MLTLLRPTLPAIVEPGRRNVGMPEPFLHTRQRSASAQHVRRPSLLQTQALVSLWGGQQPRCLTARRGARHGARAPGPSADGPWAAGRLHFVKQIGQHELQALLRGLRVEEPRGGRHTAQQGIAVLRRKVNPLISCPARTPSVGTDTTVWFSKRPK